MVSCPNTSCEHNRGGCGIYYTIKNNESQHVTCICINCMYCHDMKCFFTGYRDPNSPETCIGFEHKCSYISTVFKDMG